MEILGHPDFERGELDTGFIDRWLENRGPKSRISGVERDLAVLAAALHYTGQSTPILQDGKPTESPWKTSGRLRALRRR